MKVQFTHNPKTELTYTKALLKRRAELAHSGIPMIWPSNLKLLKDEINRQVRATDRRTVQLAKEWSQIEKRYFTILAKCPDAKLARVYNCHISNYGPEGQYRYPVGLFVRLSVQDEKLERVVETIGHELLHLAFYNYLKRKKMSYAEREGMVDAIIMQSPLKYLFPKYEMQPFGKIRPRLLGKIISSLQ